MPTYEYECEGCGHAFETVQSIRDKKLKKCPKCNTMKLNRLVGSGGGIIFKGKGFYETDYKRKNSPPDTCPAKEAGTKACPASCCAGAKGK